MRSIITILIILSLYSLSVAKHDKDKKDDDNQRAKKGTVTVIEQKPADEKIIIIRQPSERRVIVEERYPKEEDREHSHHKKEIIQKIYTTDDDIKIIREYYQEDKHKHHKRHEMSPRWKRKIIIGRPVPYEVVLERVPEDLDRRLPLLPTNYVRFMVGTSIFIKDVRTNFVIDAHFSE